MYTDILTDSYLLEYLEEAIHSLNNDEDGRRCMAEKEKILTEHPTLRAVVQDEQAVALSEADAAALIRYIKADNEMRTLEHYLCYKRGIVDGIFMAKDSGKFK